jgi:hypothetical protein
MDYAKDQYGFTPLEHDPDLMQYNNETRRNYNFIF